MNILALSISFIVSAIRRVCNSNQLPLSIYRCVLYPRHLLHLHFCWNCRSHCRKSQRTRRHLNFQQLYNNSSLSYSMASHRELWLINTSSRTWDGEESRYGSWAWTLKKSWNSLRALALQLYWPIASTGVRLAYGKMALNWVCQTSQSDCLSLCWSTR